MPFKRLRQPRATKQRSFLASASMSMMCSLRQSLTLCKYFTALFYSFPDFTSLQAERERKTEEAVVYEPRWTVGNNPRDDYRAWTKAYLGDVFGKCSVFSGLHKR